MSRRHVLATTALIPLALAATTACAGGTTAGSAFSAGPTSAAAPAPSPDAAFCTAIAQLGVQTKQVVSKPRIEAVDYLNIADAYDKVAAVAPTELVPNLATVARDYRLIGRGDTTLQKVGPEISKASQDLTAATTKICVPGQK